MARYAQKYTFRYTRKGFSKWVEANRMQGKGLGYVFNRYVYSIGYY